MIIKKYSKMIIKEDSKMIIKEDNLIIIKKDQIIKEDNLINIKEDNNIKGEIKICSKITIEINRNLINLIMNLTIINRNLQILNNLINQIMNQILILFNNKGDLIKEQKMKIHKIIDFNQIHQIINKEMIIDIKIEDKIRMNSKIIQDNLNVNIKY